MRHFVLHLILLLTFSFSAHSAFDSGRDKILGSFIKNYLESFHYKRLSLNDDLSVKAFDNYIKKLDYGKQFFLEKEVQELRIYRKQMDDQIISGKFLLVTKAEGLFKERVKVIEKWRENFFKKKFDFTQKESFESDGKKRVFLKSEKGLKEHWRKVFKQGVLSRYLSNRAAQNPDTSKTDLLKKEKEKKKKVKKLSETELWAKSKKAISKKYKDFFTRILKDDHDDHIERFFNSITTVYDPHTSFMPPKKKEDFDIDISGQLEGIGAVLSEEGSYIKVNSIVAGGAAWKQKDLQKDDIILMVAQEDGKKTDLVDMRVGDAVRFIRGKKGTIVTLTVKRADGTRKVIPIKRDTVQIGASYTKSSIIEHTDLKMKIGYIYVPKFYRNFGDAKGRNCSEDVRVELERLKKKNVKAMILDLRNNSGGALEDARIMSGLFIDKGPIVQVRNHLGEVEVLKDLDSGTTWDGPLIVMINRYSASASEIVAAALQDYKRAIIVGPRYTHGKGTVQVVLPIGQGTALRDLSDTLGAFKVTIQKFYRINGGSTQYKGVTPDIILPDSNGYAKSREKDLDYSLKWDTISPQKFKAWDKLNISLAPMIKRSSIRVSGSKRYDKVKKTVEYLTKRRDKTIISLNVKTAISEEKKSKEMSKKLKMDQKNEKIKISFFEGTLDNDGTNAGDNSKEWKKELEKRHESWVEGLQKDPGLEEAIFIMQDLVESMKGKKLSMK